MLPITSIEKKISKKYATQVQIKIKFAKRIFTMSFMVTIIHSMNERTRTSRDQKSQSQITK